MPDPITFPWQSPLFPPPPHSWRGVEMMVFPFAPEPAQVAAILPPGLDARDGMGLVTMLSYPPGDGTGIHPFREAVVMVPVTCDAAGGNADGNAEGNYVPYIYVTTDEALVAGREIAGWPKKLADITFERDGASFRGSVTRWGETLLTLEGTLTGPAPDDLLEMQGAAASTPTLNYKLIPDPAGEVVIEQITSSRLEIVPRRMELGTGRLTTASSDADPLGRLVPASEGPLVALLSDNTIPAAEVVKELPARVRV